MELTMLPEVEAEWSTKDFVEKYNITNDISSFSDEAIAEYIDSLYVDAMNSIDNLYLVISDIISDIILVDHMKNSICYITDKYIDRLEIKYVSMYTNSSIFLGVRFYDENKRSDYINKAVKLFDIDIICDKVLYYLNFKLHTLSMFYFMFKVDKLKDIIKETCNHDIIYDILEDPSNIYHKYIKER